MCSSDLPIPDRGGGEDLVFPDDGRRLTVAFRLCPPCDVLFVRPFQRKVVCQGSTVAVSPKAGPRGSLAFALLLLRSRRRAGIGFALFLANVESLDLVEVSIVICSPEEYCLLFPDGHNPVKESPGLQFPGCREPVAVRSGENSRLKAERADKQFFADAAGRGPKGPQVTLGGVGREFGPLHGAEVELADRVGGAVVVQAAYYVKLVFRDFRCV